MDDNTASVLLMIAFLVWTGVIFWLCFYFAFRD